ncbi:MAG: hypothetical protein R3F19_12295 [Verrucomicrobiales bacterium]
MHTCTLAQALDTPLRQWTTGGDASWFGQSNQNHDGSDAAASGAPPGPEQKSWLQTTVSGPATVRFQWRVATEGYGSAYLRMQLDGREQAAITGQSEWAEGVLHVPPGSHAVRFEYDKLYSYEVGGKWRVGSTSTVTPAPDSSATATGSRTTGKPSTSTGWTMVLGMTRIRTATTMNTPTAPTPTTEACW